MKKVIYCCAECGGTNVVVRAWVDANTLADPVVIDDELAWCNDCEEEVPLDEIEEEIEDGIGEE